MVVCVHTPLQEVVEIMRPTSEEISSGNRTVSGNNSSSAHDMGSVYVKPDLQVPLESPWLINWCVNTINRRENSLVVRLEALQFMGSFVKSYVFLLR